MTQAYLGTLITVNEDGTFEIPQDKLSTAGIEPGKQIEILSSSDGLFIRLAEGFCVLCGKNGNLEEINGNKFCTTCLENTYQKAKQVRASV